MGFFRFRRSVKILPGIRWNINKGGSSFTFGGRGYHYTVGNKGSRTTVGIPGTGVSYTQIHSGGAKRQKVPPPPPLTQMPATTQKPAMNKTGCLYAAGLTILGVWLLSFLAQSPTLTVNPQAAASPAATRAPLTPAASAPAAPAIAAPTVDPTLTAVRAMRVFSPPEEARLQKFVPPRVKLLREVSFRARITTAAQPAYSVAQGKEVAVIRVSGRDLVVGYAGREATIPILETDFLDRVIAEVEK